MIKKISKYITVQKIILFLAASFAAYNFGLAGGYIEGVHLSLGGIIAGVVFNISLAVAASEYGSLRGQKRTKQAQIAFLSMMLLSPVIVAPVIYVRLPAAFLVFGSEWYHVIPRVLWSAGWALVPDLAIVLSGAVSGKALISISANSAEQSAKPAGRRSQATTQSAKPASQSPQTAKSYECSWPGCEWSTEQSAAVRKGGDPQAALAAHISHHNRMLRKIEAEKQKAERDS